MRRATVAVYTVLIGIICAGMYPHSVNAGNVLLPSDSNTPSSATLPNLGLGTPANTANAPATTPPPSTSPPPLLQSTPAASTDIKEYVTTNVSPAQAATLGAGMIPTHIIHVPDTSSMLPSDKNLPYELNITFSGQSVFGASDVQILTSKLGLSSSQIASACILTARGMLLTDKSTYLIYSSTGAQPINVRYDGMIKGYVLGAVALCAADPNLLPPGAGYMTMLNNRLIIPLHPINCQAPTRQASNVVITYNGTSTGHCTYN